MKEGRIEGRVVGGRYVITGSIGVMKDVSLSEARDDPKLQAAIKRNGWEPVDG